MTIYHYLNHITLDTGHMYRSPRSEVSDATLDVVGAHLRRALDAGDDQIPGTHNRLKASSANGCLLATVMSYDGLPILTMGVAPASRNTGKLWVMLIAERRYPVEAAQPPAPPWCAVRFELPALVGDVVEWIADYERCIAWAWIEGKAK